MAKRRGAKQAQTKTNMKREIENGKFSIREVLTQSRTGHHEIQDPSERMLSIIGSSMFNEPQYYPVDAPVRRDANGNVVGHYYDDSSLDGSAKLIINTAMEIAESDSPRDLLAIANWARTEAKIRTTPQVLLAVAAEMPQTKEFVKDYCPKIIQRADELKQVFSAYRHLFGSDKALPNSLKRGLAEAFKKFGEYDFLKWEGKDRPHFADILKMVDRRKDYPLNKALDHYLKTGEIQDPEQIPMIAARKALAKIKDFTPEAKQLARKSRATWENLLSQFGNTKAIWEHLVDQGMPYMALMRNLRNMRDAGISQKHWDKVNKKLVDGALKGKQLPFRYISAEMALRGEASRAYFGRARNFPSVPEESKQAIDAIRQALEQLLKGMPAIPGRTLIAVDNSGSMDAVISQHSTMTRNMAAAVLAAMMKKRSEKDSTIGAFGQYWKVLEGGDKLTVSELAERLGGLDVGHATNAENVIEWALKVTKKYDRIIIVSDMKTYGGGGGFHRSGNYRTVANLIEAYRQRRNQDCYLHCINVAAQGDALTEQQDTQTNLISGFSEKLIDMVLEFEGLGEEVEQVKVESSKKEEVKTPERKFSIEFIRENF